MTKTTTTNDTTATALPSFHKVIQPFNTANGRTWIEIKWNSEQGELSLTGVEGARASGNSKGSCGQINLHDWVITKLSNGFSRSMVKQIRQTWKRWHLNNLRAGSPEQETFLRNLDLPNDGTWFDKAKEELTKAGLNPDNNFMHNGKPYSFGQAWIKEEVPAEVIQWLYSLPSPVLKPSDKWIVQTWFNRATV